MFLCECWFCCCNHESFPLQGFRVVQAEECWFKSLAPLMAEVRAQLGSGPVYLSFDIDALDPGFAPGTGTPEIAGLTPIQVPQVGCLNSSLSFIKLTLCIFCIFY